MNNKKIRLRDKKKKEIQKKMSAELNMCVRLSFMRANRRTEKKKKKKKKRGRTTEGEKKKLVGWWKATAIYWLRGALMMEVKRLHLKLTQR